MLRTTPPSDTSYELSLAFSITDEIILLFCLNSMQLVRGKKQLKQIFSDHYEAFALTHEKQIRRAGIPLNIDKMLKCGTEQMGYHHYRCPNCTYEKKVAHTCKSRFCSSCGVAQTDIWIERYSTLFAECEYQHVIFSPPHEFLHYFRISRKRYFNCLYAVVCQTLADWYNFRRYLPGFMLVMHTFGRDLKWHVHIHVLITCGGLNEARTSWITCNYIPHLTLKNRFKTNFLQAIFLLWETQSRGNCHPPLDACSRPAFRRRSCRR